MLLGYVYARPSRENSHLARTGYLRHSNQQILSYALLCRHNAGSSVMRKNGFFSLRRRRCESTDQRSHRSPEKLIATPAQAHAAIPPRAIPTRFLRPAFLRRSFSAPLSGGAGFLPLRSRSTKLSDYQRTRRRQSAGRTINSPARNPSRRPVGHSTVMPRMLSSSLSSIIRFATILALAAAGKRRVKRTGNGYNLCCGRVFREIVKLISRGLNRPSHPRWTVLLSGQRRVPL